ncbi:MAG: hypothetical protein VX294_02175 [Candidatus Latescibacterota bacterium]|nr:hypothetical protein [Candidatus Latescibacterota bacterium]
MKIFSQGINRIASFFPIALIMQTQYLYAENLGENDAVLELNKIFRSHYAQTRSTLLQQSGPIIIVRGDNLILIDGQQRVEGKIIDRAYHDVKAVAHAPLAIYSLLIRNEEGSIPKKTVSDLKELVKAFEKAAGAFTLRLNSKEVEKEQKKILSACIAFTSKILANNHINHVDLIKFVRGLLKPIQKNLDIAAKYRIDNYRDQIFQWQNKLSDEQWSRLVFLIPGSPMARENNLAVQFCAKLIGEKGEGSRIVYAESLFDESAALLKLGTHLFDTQIGNDVFSDPWRMHRDALGPASARYLDIISLESK